MPGEEARKFLAKLRTRATTLRTKNELRRKQMRTAKKQLKSGATKKQANGRQARTLHHGLPHENMAEEEEDMESGSSSGSEWDSDEELPPLNPDRRCIEFDNAISDETCWAQWEEWEAYCEYVDWNDQCEAVDDAWYSQDLEWVYPEALPKECATHWDNMTDDCWDQYMTLWDMCMMEGDYEETPVMWNTACDAVEDLEWAFEAVDEALYEDYWDNVED